MYAEILCTAGASVPAQLGLMIQIGEIRPGLAHSGPGAGYSIGRAVLTALDQSVAGVHLLSGGRAVEPRVEACACRDMRRVGVFVEQPRVLQRPQPPKQRATVYWLPRNHVRGAATKIAAVVAVIRPMTAAHIRPVPTHTHVVPLEQHFQLQFNSMYRFRTNGTVLSEGIALSRVVFDTHRVSSDQGIGWAAERCTLAPSPASLVDTCQVEVRAKNL